MGRKKIKSINDNICLHIVHSVTKQKMVTHKLATGELYEEKEEVLVKQLHVKKWFKKEGITSVEEYVTAKNTIAKSRSIVFDKYSGRFYATFHPAEDVINTINQQPQANQIGFKHDNKVHSGGTQVYKSRSK